MSETDGPALFPSHLGAGEGQHLFEAFLNGRLNYLVAASCTWRKPQRERQRGRGAYASPVSGKVSGRSICTIFSATAEIVTESALVSHWRCRTVASLDRRRSNSTPQMRKCGPVAMSAVTMDSCGRKRTCEEWKEGGVGSKGGDGVKRRGWRVCKRNSNQKRRRLSLEERLGSSRVSFSGGRAKGLGIKRGVTFFLLLCVRWTKLVRL